MIRAVDTLIKTTDARPSMSKLEFEALVTLLVQQYGQVAVVSALIALESGRLEAGARDLPAPVPAEPVNIEQTRSTASWAINQADGDLPAAARRLAGPVGRMVRQAARDTVWESTRKAGTRYVRVPGPRACAFCLMLASRGAVYAKDTVLAVGKKAKRPEGARYHDNCACSAREVLSDADVPQIVKDLEAEWVEVTYTGRGPVADQKKAWQEHVKRQRQAQKQRPRWMPTTAVRLRHPVGEKEELRERSTKDRHAQPSAEELRKKGLVGPTNHFDLTRATNKQELQSMLAEKKVWDWLRDRGATLHQVQAEGSIPTGNVGRPTPDFLVDGIPTDVKVAGSPRAIARQIREGKRQAKNLIVDISQTTMSQGQATEAFSAAIRREERYLHQVAIIGNGFVLYWP